MGELEKDLDYGINSLTIIDLGLEFLGIRIRRQSNGVNYIGLCPFHEEKTASFYLRPKSNRYFCYGCHASGGIINLPFNLFGNEGGLSYFERKLDFSRNNISQMSILKWHAREAFNKHKENRDYYQDIEGIWHFLENFEPFYFNGDLERIYISSVR